MVSLRAHRTGSWREIWLLRPQRPAHEWWKVVESDYDTSVLCICMAEVKLRLMRARASHWDPGAFSDDVATLVLAWHTEMWSLRKAPSAGTTFKPSTPPVLLPHPKPHLELRNLLCTCFSLPHHTTNTEHIFSVPPRTACSQRASHPRQGPEP